MFSKRKIPKNGRHKNVNFESCAVVNSDSQSQDETIPGFHFGSSTSVYHVPTNPLPWITNNPEASTSIGYTHEEFDKIIAPSDRFENLLSDNNNERKPEIFVPIDTHHFDEEDYHNHRHRVYPHMHQPLKSMEPRVLRKIKEKIRDNKKAQLKAATAGVPTSVPQLLACATDSRVLIGTTNTSRVISGPVLGLVRSEEQGSENIGNVGSATTSVPECIEINKYNESAVIPSLSSRKRRKRKRRRSKKQEPFQPTLGKLSEESSSPINSAAEIDRFVGDLDEFEDDFEEEGEEGNPEQGGLILEELCSVVSADKAIEDVSFFFGDSRSTDQLDSPEESKMRIIPFLEEISSCDQPIGFLDMMLQTKNIRKHSLPVFVDAGHSDEKPDFITSQSSADLIDCKRPKKLLQFNGQPVDHSDHAKILSTAIPEPEEGDNVYIADDLKSTSNSLVSLSSTTHAHSDLNQSGLTQVASTSALTGESCIKLSNCNFHIGSFDSITTSKTNVFNLQSILPSNGGTPEPPNLPLKQSPPHHYPHHHHYHHHKEHYTKRDLEKRTFSGQDMRSLCQSKDQDEINEHQSMLGDAIIDDMRSHRCYDMPAFNRTRFRTKYAHSHKEKKLIQRSRSESHSQTAAAAAAGPSKISQEKIKTCTTCGDESYQTPDYTKSQQDLIFQSNFCQNDCNCVDGMLDDPLPLFVEMDILKPLIYWREVSRWVRYEQCYNELSDIFGRAHNSPLKFTAFTQFRVQMEDALFMPFVEAKSLTEAINQLVEQLLVSQLFTELRDAAYVREVLRFRHIHAGEKISNDIEDLPTVQSDNVHLSDCSANILHTTDNNEQNMRHNYTTSGNLINIFSNNSFYSSSSKIKNTTDNSGIKYQDSNVGFKYGQHSNFPSMIKMLKNSIPILRHPKQHKSDLEGHLPINTEGVTVQVGELSELKKPFLAIMRFKTPFCMEKVMELNIPVRFMIVCLGPVGRVKYEELGRVISTMMINKDFRRMMYRATDKYEIIEGLYKYLDTCFVLSYSGPHPTRNIHTMVDHINDFCRVQCNISPLRSVSKENESIKHSVSVNWADEQHSQLVKRTDQQKHNDPEIGGDRKISYTNIDYESSENDKISASLSKGDAFRVTITQGYKMDDELSKALSNKVPTVHLGVFPNIFFFLFRLLRLDIVNYLQRFPSDFLDAIKKENIIIVLCGLLYLYFICLSPALTFGALLGELVSDKFGVQLVLTSQGALLILFSLFGGNPLLVIGITGPMFLMESVIGKMAFSFDIPILMYRFIVAIYCTVIGIISLAFNITWVMQKVRRSVEECFNGFVGLYFIFKAILTIFKIFTITEPLSISSHLTVPSDNASQVVNKNQYLYDNRVPVGLASLVMAYSMYQICTALNGVKRGRFFTRKIRKMIDYFNVAIAILVLSLVNVIISNMIGIHLPTLETEGNNTSWIKLPPVTNSSLSISFTAHMIAFLLAFALLSLNFTETAIAGITVTRQDRKLLKPSLFAQDQFMLLCVIPMISGLFGWPFVSGAAVRSTSHVIAMTKWDQKVIPGMHHKILGVVEQRVTLLVVGALVLTTVSVESLLNYVPTSAMLGMFLYMGVMGIRDLVVTRRLVAMFKRRKHWKDHEYLRDIPPAVLKSFEILQLAMIILMFSMNCVTEFLGISWCSFLIPALLLLFAACRELVLPKIPWFEHHLDKIDPRHVIHIANICLSSHTIDHRSPSNKSPAITNRPISSNSGGMVSNVVMYNPDSQSDIDDSVDTSGNEMSSCTSSDQDS